MPISFQTFMRPSSGHSSREHLPKTSLLSALFALAFIIHPVSAQEAASEAVGFYQAQIGSATTANLAPLLLPSATAGGQVRSVSTTQQINVAWNGDTTDAGTSVWLPVSGLNAGLPMFGEPIVANGQWSVRTQYFGAALASSPLLVGDRVRVFPFWTTDPFAGSPESSDIFSATTKAEADNFSFPPGSAPFLWASSLGDTAHWAISDTDSNDSNDLEAGDTVITEVTDALLYRRRGTLPRTLVVTGDARPTNVLFPIVPSLSNSAVYNPLYFPDGREVNLQSLYTSTTPKLFTGVAGTGLVGATTAAAADKIFIRSEDSDALVGYYYNTTAKAWKTNIGATESLVPTAASVKIRAASVFYVVRPYGVVG